MKIVQKFKNVKFKSEEEQSREGNEMYTALLFSIKNDNQIVFVYKLYITLVCVDIISQRN